MRFLRNNRKQLNTVVFNEEDFSVLNYEQLLKVNGAGGSGSGGSSGGPSGGNLADKGYPSSNDGYGGLTTNKSSDSKVTYENGVVHVDNTDPKTNDMAVNHSYGLATEIKNEYYKQYGESLGISTESLAAEIKVHADLYNKGFATEHTNFADCGVNDKERIVWDTASVFGYGKQ